MLMCSRFFFNEFSQFTRKCGVWQIACTFFREAAGSGKGLPGRVLAWNASMGTFSLPSTLFVFLPEPSSFLWFGPGVWRARQRPSQSTHAWRLSCCCA